MGTLKMRTESSTDAAKMAAGMIQAARSEAITNGKKSRVAICVAPTDAGDYLRQIVILISNQPDNSANNAPEEWRVNTIRRLPEGTAFRSNFSQAKETMSLDLNGPIKIQSGQGGSKYTFIEFDPLGQCHSSVQWIFSRAEFDSTEPTFPNELDRHGFILRKTGKIAWFHTPQQIKRSAPGS